MRKIRLTAVVLAATLVFGVPTACSDSGSGPGGGVNLAGTYTLVSLLLGGLLPAPGSTGILVFTSSSFSADIDVVSPDTLLVPDTALVLFGTYSAKHTSSGDSVYLVLPGALGTIAGTFDIRGAQQDTLVLNLATPLGNLGSTWYKQ
jgi:hypothetical protein